MPSNSCAAITLTDETGVGRVTFLGEGKPSKMFLPTPGLWFSNQSEQVRIPQVRVYKLRDRGRRGVTLLTCSNLPRRRPFFLLRSLGTRTRRWKSWSGWQRTSELQTSDRSSRFSRTCTCALSMRRSFFADCVELRHGRVHVRRRETEFGLWNRT